MRQSVYVSVRCESPFEAYLDAQYPGPLIEFLPVFAGRIAGLAGKEICKGELWYPFKRDHKEDS